MNTNINVGQLIGQIGNIVTQIIGYGLLLLIAAAVVGRYGVKAWFLYRGGRIT